MFITEILTILCEQIKSLSKLKTIIMDRDDIIVLLQGKLRKAYEDSECMLSNQDYDRGVINTLEGLILEIGPKSRGI